MTSNLTKNLKQPALDFLSFVNASPTRNFPSFPVE
jgi:aspartyl aminopeptidase